MTISEMHIWFRQYAQQMGMQNIRALLPEQIDLLINTSIQDTVKTIIQESVGITNDRVITDNSKIGQINALRSLYRVKLIDMSPVAPIEAGKETRTFSFSASDKNTGKMTTDFKTYNGEPVNLPDYLFLVDFSLNYKQTDNNKGYTGIKDDFQEYAQPEFKLDSLETNFFPVRLIDDAFLADTINDFILKNRLRSPIIVCYSKQGVNGIEQVLDLYIDKFNKFKDGYDVRYVLDNGLIPYQLRMSYIAKPTQVKYLADIQSEEANINCDLPEYMHVDILKHAVDLYKIAISGSLYGRQQTKNAQQESTENTNQ